MFVCYVSGVIMDVYYYGIAKHAQQKRQKKKKTLKSTG